MRRLDTGFLYDLAELEVTLKIKTNENYDYVRSNPSSRASNILAVLGVDKQQEHMSRAVYDGC